MQDDFYDRFGFDSEGFDRKGFDRSGYDREGYHRYTKRNRQGFDRKGVHYLARRPKRANLELKEQKRRQREEAQRLLNMAINHLRSGSQTKGNPDLWPMFRELARQANYVLTGFELPNDALRREIYRQGVLLMHPDRGGDENDFKAFTLFNENLKKLLINPR